MPSITESCQELDCPSVRLFKGTPFTPDIIAVARGIDAPSVNMILPTHAALITSLIIAPIGMGMEVDVDSEPPSAWLS